MNIIYIFVYLYLLLKPYYIFASGGLQISDICILIALFLLIFIHRDNKDRLKDAISNNKYFLIFLILSFAVNIAYFICYLKFKFILSSLYLLFNFMAIIMFSFCFKNEKFIENAQKIFKLNIIIQLLINVLNIGRYYDATRYMGTFNDPNQFSFYLLMSLTFIYLVNERNGSQEKSLPITLITSYLIIKSASTGMFMGLLILLVVWFYRYSKDSKLFKYLIVIMVLLGFGISLYNVPIINDFIANNSDNVLIGRINNKLERINSSDNGPSLIEERGYDKIINNPHYILYGAGEGEYGRFSSFSSNEIHATFPSLLFYYGIIPFMALMKWVYQKFKGNKWTIILLFLSIFIESFTLLNHRQALFWVIILFYEFTNKQKQNVE